jgi:hypothetical protein
VPDHENGPVTTVAANQLLDQVGLPVQRVVVVARLLREPEAEEVGRKDRVLGLLLEKQPPVVRARREPVEQEQKRPAAAALEDMDPTAAKVLASTALSPGENASGEPPYFFFTGFL